MSARGHLLVLAVTFLSLVFVLRLLRRGQVAARYALLWMSITTVLLFLATFPGTLDRISLWLGITYGPATFLLGAVTVLFMIVIQFSWELSRLEERTQVLAEEIALLRADQARPEEEVATGA